MAFRHLKRPNGASDFESESKTAGGRRSNPVRMPEFFRNEHLELWDVRIQPKSDIQKNKKLRNRLPIIIMIKEFTQSK